MQAAPDELQANTCILLSRGIRNDFDGNWVKFEIDVVTINSRKFVKLLELNCI